MKKKIIAGAAVVAVLGVLAGFTFGGGGKSSAVEVRTMQLTKGDLASTISATGTVTSKESTNVYSNLSYTVKTVHVSVGDVVAEGDMLMELDTASLESDIAQKRASVSAQQAASAQSVAIAQQDLDTYKYNRENNYETSLLNAEASVRSAELELEAASADLLNARYDLRKIKDDGYDNYDTEATYDDALHTKRELVTSREITYEKAKANLEKAKESLEAIKVGSDNDVTSYENKLKTAEISNNHNDQYIAIQKLEDDLSKATVTAPITGTVTAVLATEGASGNGLMFVIQDADALKIITNIKEYDVSSITLGDKVTIKSDATGEELYEGILSKIAPTSKTSNKGETSDSTDAEYESEVDVISKNSGLLIGMNTRLNIITEEKSDIYSIPYEALATDETGASVIYVATAQEDGSYIVEAVPVDVGMETDLYVEISSDTLTGELQVIRDIAGIMPGMAVTLPLDENQAGADGQGQRGGVMVRMG